MAGKAFAGRDRRGSRFVGSLIVVPGRRRPKWFSDQQEFCRRLEMDGFVVSEGEITSGALRMTWVLPAAQDKLRHLLGSTISQRHPGISSKPSTLMQKAIGLPDSQIRTFFDALLDQICERLDPNTKSSAASRVEPSSPRRGSQPRSKRVG